MIASAAAIISGDEHGHQQHGADQVEGPLQGEVDALEDRRLQLEERQRLAGHVLHPLHQDLHRGRRHAHAHALLVAAVHQLDGLLRGEVGVRDQDLVDRVEVALELLERAEVAQAVHQRHRRARHEAVGLDLAAVAQRVRDRLDVRAGADQHRPAAVAGGAQDRPGHPLERPAESRHVDQREQQRPVEDVERLEVLALEQRVDQHHHGGLEERRDHARKPGALRPLAVEPGAAEQQQHHQPAQRQVVERLVPHLPDLVGMAQGRLHEQRGVDREEEAGEIERREGGDARDGPGEVEPQQPSEQGLTRPHVALVATKAAQPPEVL